VNSKKGSDKENLLGFKLYGIRIRLRIVWMMGLGYHVEGGEDKE
jgi:hypothetical protein